MSSTSRWKPSSGPLVLHDILFEKAAKATRHAILLENVGALLSGQKNCRALFTYILKATVRRKFAEAHRTLCISRCKSLCNQDLYIFFNVMLSGSTTEKDEGPLGHRVPPECGFERREQSSLFKGQSRCFGSFYFSGKAQEDLHPDYT